MRAKLTLNWRGKTAALPDYIFDDITPPAPPPRTLVPRVLAVDPWVEPDPLDYCLDCWRRWMNQDDRDLSASRMKLAGAPEEGDDDEQVGYQSDVYADQAKADAVIGAATGAMIAGLCALHRTAIHKMQRVTTQWTFPNADYAVAAQEACALLREKLRTNIATSIYFT